MTSLAGVVFDGASYIGYRVTDADGKGKHTRDFFQAVGYMEIPDAAPVGAGVCVPGLHITSAARAWTYFGVDPDAQMWIARVKPEDVLDSDGEKVRIRAGHFTKTTKPF